MPTSAEQKQDGWLSVTEVLDTFIPKGLLDWYLKTGKKEAKRLSTVALKIGSRVDELIQQDIKDGSYKLTAKDPIEVKNCMDAWQKFKSDYSPVGLTTQIEVKDEIKKIVGHIDLATHTTVIDVKCASSIKDNYWIQVSEYLDMYPVRKEFYDVAILRLDKNLGTYQYMTGRQAGISIDECLDVFDGLLSAYRYYNKPKGQEE